MFDQTAGVLQVQPDMRKAACFSRISQAQGGGMSGMELIGLGMCSCISITDTAYCVHKSHCLVACGRLDENAKNNAMDDNAEKMRWMIGTCQAASRIQEPVTANVLCRADGSSGMLQRTTAA